MNQELLDHYFEEELYLQNLPLKTDKFIKFCKKRGIKIDKQKLEYLEKNDLFYPMFRIELIYEKEWDLYAHPASNIVHFLKVSYDQNKVYLPNKENFKPFTEYYDKIKEEYDVYTYYSSYQIYQLDLLLNKGYKQIPKYVNRLIDLLIGIQVYSPYGRSNMRLINVKDNDYNWRLHLKRFDLDKILKIIGIDEDFIFEAYKEICKNLKPLLGSNDAIQLWKHINWDKKNKCIGNTRLGIEYLEWAMMLKRCIEKYIGREIYDVDEISNYGLEKIKNTIPSKEKGQNPRGIRNRYFYNEISETYEFNLNRKNLFYLSNSLTLDYHPRIILFVEGKTEELLIPEFYREFCGDFEDAGFEIINIGGISGFFSGELADKQPSGRYMKLIVSNFTNLINFNLKLWQAIPFFVGDNENNILENLQKGKIFNLKDTFYLIHGISVNEYEKTFKYLLNEFIEFLKGFEMNFHETPFLEEFLNNNFNMVQNMNSSFIKEWSEIWKLDFELDNYKPEELQKAILEICDKEISLEKIKKIYQQTPDGKKQGIKDLGEDIDENKIALNMKLLENLIEYYDESQDPEVFNRPIFKLLRKLKDLKYYYKTPKNTKESIDNQREIYREILHSQNEIN